ncbi:site-specific integrase [Pseudoalteromonas lipolytica]|uniref:Site-specific integrase n=1 Tax=Pseudoalteromonas lipolytica TaxID=570156 RepID=A0ABU8SYS5_9GAMM
MALIWFLFGSLTRIGETCQLLVKDVFTKSGELKSIFRMRADYTKTNQSRDCALVLKQQRQAVLRWRDKRIADKAMLSVGGSYGGLNGDSPLFLARSGKRWVTLSFNVKKYQTQDGQKETLVFSSMENYVRNLFKSCGFKQGSSHSLRKSTASLLSDAGVDYDVIQMAIGHVSDDMTDTYIIPDPQRLTAALNNLYKSVPPLGIKE